MNRHIDTHFECKTEENETLTRTNIYKQVQEKFVVILPMVIVVVVEHYVDYAQMERHNMDVVVNVIMILIVRHALDINQKYVLPLNVMILDVRQEKSV